MKNVLVVIPCYNESSRLDKERFLSGVNQYGFDLLFVNDGSKDDTLEALKTIEKENPEHIRVLDLPQNGGKAEAVRQGMQYSLSWKSFDAAGYADADLSTPFSELHRLTDYFKEHNFVFGSRIVRLGGKIKRESSRFYFGRISAHVAAITLGLDVYDTQCGAKFFKADLVPILFDKPFLSRWLFDVELFFRMMNRFGKANTIEQTLEVPLDIWEEQGDSKLTTQDVLKVPFELWRIRKHYRKLNA